MPVSPQDFALYSRMTGSPVPTDAATRMQMAPDVYKFTKDFAKKPNILETTGNLVKTIGKNVGMGMALAAASPGFVKEPKTTSENYDQTEVPNQTAKKVVKESLKRGAELADSTNVAEELSESEESRPAFEMRDSAYEETVGLPATSERVSGFLSQFPALKGKESPNIDPVLMGAMDQRLIPTEMVGRGLDGPSSTISAGLNRFEHPDIKADGGEHDDDLVGAENFKTGTQMAPETVKTISVSDKGDKFLEDLVKEAQKDLGDPDAMMDKPSFSYPTTRAGRQEVGITEGGDIYQIFKKDPEKTYITRATPRQAEMFQEMLPTHLTDDREKTPGAGGFLTAFTNKTFDF